MSYALLFPGQGSQFVGMGADLFEARPDLLGSRANEILGFDLAALCLEGPDEVLTRTEHAQPALFAVSYALWAEVGGHLPGVPAGMAGHSLGEYTALAAAGAIGYEDALAVVGQRGRAMAAAADAEPSGMAALVGADLDLATAVCDARSAQGGRLSVANINTPAQIVVAGGQADIEWLVEHGRDQGIRRVIPLKVAGGFHSSFMAPAAKAVSAALADVEISDPTVDVWANTTARPHVTGEIPEIMARQVVETVRFAESLESMFRAGIDTFVHVGPGDVTAGLARKTVDATTTHVISTLDDVAAVADSMGRIVRPEEGP